jgi:acetyltransferase-like isoleucine patch superfamily enzyme
MTQASLIQQKNILLESASPLSSEQKKMFSYFGVNAKIVPPMRILNPQNISIGDYTSIREWCHINAFIDLSFLMDYIDPAFRSDFSVAQYQYESKIVIERECLIGRFSFMSCTRSIVIERNVIFSERVFVGDNNHDYTHPRVPIMQQPNLPGEPVVIGTGSWIGVGAAILAGVQLGRNTVVGANSVVKRGRYPSYAVIAIPAAEVLSRRHSDNE